VPLPTLAVASSRPTKEADEAAPNDGDVYAAPLLLGNRMTASRLGASGEPPGDRARDKGRVVPDTEQER
jgi:hypothetical protein